LILFRLIATGSLAVSLFLSIINPILAVVLIIGVAIVINLALRLVANLKPLGIILYLLYVGVVFLVGSLWLTSIVTTGQAAVIFVPATIGYWIVSWNSVGK
jgi:hypothetical protein